MEQHTETTVRLTAEEVREAIANWVRLYASGDGPSVRTETVKIWCAGSSTALREFYAEATT